MITTTTILSACSACASFVSLILSYKAFRRATDAYENSIKDSAQLLKMIAHTREVESKVKENASGVQAMNDIIADNATKTSTVAKRLALLELKVKSYRGKYNGTNKGK